MLRMLTHSVYLLSDSLPLQAIMGRVVRACSLRLRVLDDIGQLEACRVAHGEILVVDARLLTDGQRCEELRAAVREMTVLLLNESLDEAVVGLLRGAPFNHAIHAAHLDVHQLVVMINKLMSGDIFGIEKYLPWGVPVERIEVGAYDDKERAITEVSEFLRQLGCRALPSAGIATAIDEALMNALYRAPRRELDARALGRHDGDPWGCTGEHVAVLQYASSGRFLVVSVEDPCGRLDKNTVVQRMAWTKPAMTDGSGLGLFLLVNRASHVIANVAPGKRTELIFFFDLETPTRPKGIQAFHYFRAPTDLHPAGDGLPDLSDLPA